MLDRTPGLSPSGQRKPVISGPELVGRRILIVEDQYPLAAHLRRCLQAAGAVVLGPAPSVSQAHVLISPPAKIDAAVLDVNLGGEKVYPIADVLLARGTPFVFATGYSAQMLPEPYRMVVRMEKPLDFGTLARVLAELVRR